MLRSLAALLCFILLAALLQAAPARSASRLALPDGFELWLTAPGVIVYGNETVAEAQEYVQVIDLGAGARLHFWHGPVSSTQRSIGLFGGSSPSFERHYLPDVWLSLSATEPDMLCLANGQFFRDTVNGMWVNPTELAFPLKAEGVVISEGYEQRRFRNQRVMLQLWSHHASLSPLTRQAFYSSTAPSIIAGLHEEARVRPTEELGRTLLGVGDGNGDGFKEQLLIYSGAAATQAHALRTIRAFGAQEAMWLDGGGSAQLACEGASYINRIRPLPQMLATIPAARHAPAADPHLSLFEQMLARWLQLLERAK